MSEDILLKVTRRKETGKKVRHLRREGWVPGVAYGPNMESLALQILRKEFIEVYRQAGSTSLIQVQVKGQRQTQPALIRDIQRDPITQEILHVDLTFVDLKRPITAHVPILWVGTAPVVEQRMGVLSHAAEEVEVRCLPSDVPAHFEVDLSTITRVDQSIQVIDLTVPEGVHILSDPETVLVYVTTMRPPEEEEELLVGEAVEEEAAEAADEE